MAWNANHIGRAPASKVVIGLRPRISSIVRTIEALTGEAIPGIHIVGGGCRNDYLDQATADASGRPVLAGPAEATATGNVLLQAVASGELASIAEGRQLVARTACPRRFEPRDRPGWKDAAERYEEIEGRFTDRS